MDNSAQSTGSHFSLTHDALKIMETKALNGDSDLALKIARHYTYSKVDLVKSFYWYKVSAESGNGEAAIFLGDIYRDYFNDTEEAVFWYLKGLGAEPEIANNNIADLLWKHSRYSDASEYYYQAALSGSTRAAKQMARYRMDVQYGSVDFVAALGWALYWQQFLIENSYSFSEADELIEGLRNNLTESERVSSSEFLKKLNQLHSQKAEDNN